MDYLAFCFPAQSCWLVMNYSTYYTMATIVALLLIFLLLSVIQSRRLRQRSRDLIKFKSAVESAYDHIIFTDRNGFVIYGNRAVERVTGYKLKEVIGQKAGKLWGGQMTKEFYQKMWQKIAVKKETFSGEVVNRHKNGQDYYAQITVTPVLNNRGNIIFFIGVERDISKEKELDQAKSDFISIASHQLRTPLTVIKGYISMLQEKSFGPLTAQQLEILGKVYESNERQIALVQDLLNISRIEAGKIKYDFSEVDLGALTKSVVEELRGVAQAKKLKLSLTVPLNLPKVWADADKLRQILMNFIDNAIKYTPAGSVAVILSADKNKLRFVVKDSGLGIKAEEMPYLFSKYSRGSGKSGKTKTIKGNGLGLYVAKMIAEAHKGRVGAESAGENQGSLFFVELPVKR